jgi:2-methylcitrate dehydratase PrpD
LFVDQIGVTYMGHEATGKALCAYAADADGKPEALLIGTDQKTSCGLAAGINAQVGRNADFEDTGPGLHPGPLVVHTALAVAQRCGSSGQELLAAMALGYDLNARFFKASTAGPDVRHNTMIAAAITAKLLDLDQDKIARALSLAWEFPIKAANYTRPRVSKRISALGMGHFFSAQNGVQAALMTTHGFESVVDEVDQLGDVYDLDILVDQSKRYHDIEHALFLKPWPTSHACHAVIQSIEDLMTTHDLTASDITAVRAGLPDIYLMPHQNNNHPETYWEAVYSVAWSFAMVIHRVPPGPAWFTASRIKDQVYHALTECITGVEHPPATEAMKTLDLESVDGWVELETAKGTLRAERNMRDTYGSPTTPMPEEMFKGKFMRTAEPSIGAVRASALYADLWDVAEIVDVTILVEKMSP